MDRQHDQSKSNPIISFREKRRGQNADISRKRHFDGHYTNDQYQRHTDGQASSYRQDDRHRIHLQRHHQQRQHHHQHYHRHDRLGNVRYQRRSPSPEEVGEIRSDRPTKSTERWKDNRREDYRNGSREDDFDKTYHRSHSKSNIESPLRRYKTSPDRGRSSRSFNFDHSGQSRQYDRVDRPVITTTLRRRLGDQLSMERSEVSLSKDGKESELRTKTGPTPSDNEEKITSEKTLEPSHRKSSLLLTPEGLPQEESETKLLSSLVHDCWPLLSPDISLGSKSSSRSVAADTKEAELPDDSDVDGRSPYLSESESLSAVGTTQDGTTPDFITTGHLVRCPLLNGCRRVDAYRRLNKISEGTYGAVYRAHSRQTNEIVALKHIKYHERVWEEGFPLTSLREISILLELKHPNVVNVVEVVVGENPNQVYMVMEYVEHELKLLLEDNRPPFSTSERKALIHQVNKYLMKRKYLNIGTKLVNTPRISLIKESGMLLQAVEYMHSRWVMHRDLKTSNLLYSNQGELKVCDFGMARKFGDPIRAYTHNVVTMWYRAPELLLGQERYTEAVDMWSVGCIMAEILLRKPLFDGRSETETLDKIFRLCGTPSEETWPGLSSLPLIANTKIEFVKHNASWRKIFPIPRPAFSDASAITDTGLDLLTSLLSLNPQTRISAKDALKHPFFEEKPLPQRLHLMPSAPDTNVRDRQLRRPEDSLNEQDLLDRDLFHGQEARYTLGSRVDPKRYLIEMETAAQKLQQEKQQKNKGGSAVV